MKDVIAGFQGGAVGRLVAGFSLCLVLFGAGNAGASPIVASFYTATPGEGMAQGGTFNYFDDTGSQLTDGVFGVNDWTADLGNGPAYEWVGWRVANPTITFTFANPANVDQVQIDFNRTEPAGSLIFLPSTVTINGMNFAVAANAIPDMTRGTLDFNGLWSGTTLTITLTDNDPNLWIFVDEISFDGTMVPEMSPGSFLVLAAGLGWIYSHQALRRRSFHVLTPDL